MAERFTQRGQIGVQNLRSGASEGLMGLSRQFEQFANQARQARVEKAVEEAELAGQQAGLDLEEGEKPEFKEEGFIGGVQAKAFNRGLRDAYVAGVANDARERLNQIELENPTDVAAYDNAAQAYLNAVKQEADPVSLPFIQQHLEKSISMGRTRVQESGFKAQREAAQKQLDVASDGFRADAARHARNGNTEAASKSLSMAIQAIEARFAGGFIKSREAADKAIRLARQEVKEQELRRTVEDIVESDGLDSAYDQLASVSKTVPEGWEPDAWDTVTASIEADLNRQSARAKAAIKEQADEADKQASISRGKLFATTEVPADPAKSSQDRKDVNSYYDAESQAWQSLPTQEQVNRNVEFVRGSGLVPDKLISAINATSRSGTPEQVQVIADVVSRIQELPNSANAIRDLPDEARAFYRQVSDNARAGMLMEDAIEIARKTTFGQTAQQREALKIKSQEAAPELEGWLKDQAHNYYTPGLFEFDVNIPVDMQADYNVAFNGFMAKTDGNTEQAKELAFGTLKKRWAVTEVGGSRRYMKYAPEAFYSVEGFDNSWIENQFNEEMEEAGFVGAELSTNFNTGRQEAPSYPVIITNEQGLPDIARNPETGREWTWRPDFRRTDEYREITEAPGKAIENARQKRERAMVRRAGALRRSVLQRALQGQGIPRSQRQEFLASDEGRTLIARAINNMEVLGKADKVEAKQMREAFEVQ